MHMDERGSVDEDTPCLPILLLPHLQADSLNLPMYSESAGREPFYRRRRAELPTVSRTRSAKKKKKLKPAISPCRLLQNILILIGGSLGDLIKARSSGVGY